MEQHTYPDGVAGAPVAAHQAPQSHPTMPIPQSGPQPVPPLGTPAGYAPGLPVKKKWWSLPKVLVAAGIAVLLAGGGGAAIGYSMGKTDATRQVAQRFQNGRPNGANGQARRGPGQGQPTAPSTPGGGINP
ncbi:MAG: hypothetical protein NTU93_12780 [Arthrobacter sp.]|nr:hypothetical protein [Arthrobacter sp.]